MKVERDHYRVLDLPPGKEGIKLTRKQITKAYKRKALQLHPDKRPNDPDAISKFQRLQSSYETLMDPHARKVFDDSLMRLDKKFSPSTPKKQTSSSSQPPKRKNCDGPKEVDIEVYVFLYVASLPFMMLRASARADICTWSGFFLISLPIVCWTIAYFFKPDPPSAATNQESQREDHEDLQDWVMV